MRDYVCDAGSYKGYEPQGVLNIAVDSFADLGMGLVCLWLPNRIREQKISTFRAM